MVEEAGNIRHPSGDGRLKILVLIKGLGLGGAERLLVDALPYLDGGRFRYEFAYLLPGKDALVPQVERAGFRVYCLGLQDGRRRATDGRSPFAFRRGREVILLALALGRLRALHKRCRYDLIQADMPLAGVLARLVGRWEGVPVVYTEHNLQERYHPLTRWANRMTYGWNSRVLAVSAAVAASIERFGLHRKAEVATLLNAVPVEQVRAEASDLNGLREELGIPATHLVVGTLAVFLPQKRLEDWLEVAARVLAQRQDVTFLLVGHGPQGAELRARVQSRDLSGRVLMPGFRPDGRRALGLMDVYLMTSVHEGLPLALLEAMAMGVPVVATAVGGIPEAVQPGQNGLLAPLGAVDDLVQHTVRLLDDPGLRQQMGRRGAERIEADFHVKRRVRSFEDLYLGVLQEAGRG